MNIVNLRNRVKLKKHINALNDYVATITHWQTLATVWAEIKPISGREYFSVQQVQSEVTTQIWIRYRKDIEPTMRVTYQDKHYEIVSVLNYQGLNKTLQLMCKDWENG